VSADLAAVLGTLDPTSDRAVFRQIADHLRDAIEKGRLAENQQIPSETVLTEHYGVARMTVRNAIQVLQGEGLVLAEHGRGVFVRPRPPVRRLASDRFARRNREQGKAAFIAEAEQAGSRPEVDSIVIAEERPSRDISSRLGTTGKVLARHRRYLLDGQPVETAVSYIPLDIARGTPITEPNPGPGGIYARLEEAGHRLDHFDEEVRSRMPVPEEVRALRLSPGVPVFHLVRTAYDTDGRKVEVCDTIMAADAYVLAYSLPAR
jgi:GntR family transcriptional regulator